MTSDNELPFRIAVGIFWFINMLVRVYFQSKAAGIEVSVAAHKERAKLFFRMFALAYLVIPFYIFSPWLDFASIPLHAAARWLFGAGLLIAFLLLFSWTHQSLGKNWSGLLEIHKDHALVVSGPYRFIRHPMYAAFILSGFGYLFLSANWLVGGLYIVIASMMYLDRVAPEEKMMTEHFGEAYTQYVKRTGRLFPKIRSLHTS